MMKNWHDISLQLKDEFDSSVYNVWISTIDGSVSYSDMEMATLTLKVRTLYASNWIQKKYLDTILKVSCRVLGFEPAIEFEVSQANQEKMNTEKMVQELPTAPSIIASDNTIYPSTSFVMPASVAQVRMSANDKRIQKLKHSFDTFVVGPCNQLALAAAKEITREESPTDMLFLSSAPGLGKTHLTQAIAKELHSKSIQTDLSGRTNAAYLTAEEFFNQFSQACHYKNVYEFKKRFRELDLLVLEDVHSMQKMGKTQEALCEIVKHLQDNGKKVVFTSSLALCDMQGLDSQLVSRFRSGFVASIEYPDFTTKKAMLMQKAKLRDFFLPENVASLFAERLEGDIRLLESSLNTLILRSQLLNEPVTEEIAFSILAQVASTHAELSLDELVKVVCSCCGISEKQLKSTSRKQEYVTARNVAFYLMRKHFAITLEDIGKYFDRGHSTVSKAITSIDAEISKRSRLGMQLADTIHSIESVTVNSKKFAM